MRDECEHGNLRRQCELCERDQKIEALQREASSIGREVDRQARRAEEAERKLEERKWRPIETAPNHVEFRCLLGHRHSVVTGYWDGHGWVNERSLERSYFPATHWKPIPETPKEAG